SVY
ncbi:putative non-LEE-encoded type III secreted effector, partial [Escherichia coli 95.1288]